MDLIQLFKRFIYENDGTTVIKSWHRVSGQGGSVPIVGPDTNNIVNPPAVSDGDGSTFIQGSRDNVRELSSKGQINFDGSIGTGSNPSRGQVSWAEFEVPGVVTRGQVSWAEFEIPIALTRGRVSWAELEVPSLLTRGRISWAEFEIPNAPTRGQVSQAEFEIPDPLAGDGGWGLTSVSGILIVEDE